MIPDQAGLLADEIYYRLDLLVHNVVEPLSDYAVKNGYGAPEILEAFRYQTTGLSQHERGEAADVAFQVTSDQVLALATWVRDNLAYDQLILCHAPARSWLHISYTPDNRRRQVFTKDFRDEFHEGLHLYRNYTSDASRQSAIQDSRAEVDAVSTQLADAATRDARRV